MKSVLKTFSQSTWNVMTKACLTVLCVFVLSNVGSAQSLLGESAPTQVLKSVVSELQVDFDNKYEGTRINPANTDELSVRYHYFTSLMEYFSGTQALPASTITTVIEKNHYKMTGRFDSQESTSVLLAQLKQEATNLLSN